MASKFSFFSDPLELYSSMLKDIEKAKKSIYLETYIFESDSLGKRFEDVLRRKAAGGIEVKVLIDAWGARVNDSFFARLRAAGADVRFFRKIVFKLAFFTHNHRRDHRKILVVDSNVCYVGSSNISNECIYWRESNLRIEGSFALKFKKVFKVLFENNSAPIQLHSRKHRIFSSEGLRVIPDAPSLTNQKIRREHVNMIKSAKRSILIETPYFVTDIYFRRLLKKAARRGITVVLVLPKFSDIRLVDILKEKYLGGLYRAGVMIYYYLPRVLHSKLMIVDDEKFIVGSANLDFRSFIYQYELAVSGKNEDVALMVQNHIDESINDSEAFDYQKWKSRSWLLKLLESFLALFKQFL